MSFVKESFDAPFWRCVENQQVQIDNSLNAPAIDSMGTVHNSPRLAFNASHQVKN